MSAFPPNNRNNTDTEYQNELDSAAEQATVDSIEPSGSLQISPETATLRVIFQQRRGRLYLYGLNVSASDTGEDLMGKVRGMFDREVSAYRLLRGRPVLLWKPVVDIAILSSVGEYL